MTPSFGGLAERPTCGRGRCVVHRLCNERVQEKYYDKTFNGMIGETYTSEELAKLRAVANGLG